MKANRKKNGGAEFVETSRPFEKVALDLIDMRREGTYIIVAIDYFTTFIVADVNNNNESKTVIGKVKEWCNIGYIQEEFITDNGKELTSLDWKEMCRDLKIRHHVVGVASHISNGRV